MAHEDVSHLFIELMKIGEKADPGFIDRWNTWADNLETPIEPLDERDLITPPLPHAIRGRGERLETADDLKDEFEYAEFEPGWYYTIHARQGGGNDECWCEEEHEDDETHESGCLWQNNKEFRSHPSHVYDEYGDDSTYITHVFRVNATDAEVERVQSSEKRSYEQKSQIANRDAATAGKVTPWAALNNLVSESLSYTRELHAVLKYEADLEKSITREKELDSQEQAISALPNDFTLAEVKALGINPTHSLGYRSNVTIDALNALLEQFEESEERLATAKRKLHDAETYLPSDSPLRNELLADRGTGSYETTERRGRRNVKVKNTYDRSSKLGFEIIQAERRIDGARINALRNLNAIINEERKKNKTPNDNVGDTPESILNKLFALGWGHDSSPELPNSFAESLKVSNR